MEHLPDPSGPGTVVLDIGGEIGAAVLVTPASLDGCEIEIRPQGGSWDGVHVAVRPRHLASGVVHAAVFDHLVQGHYEARMRGDEMRSVPFVVEGGRVTEGAFRHG